MGLLDIEIQRTGDRISAIGNGIEYGFDTVDPRTLYLIGVLIEKAKTEDAPCLWIGFQLLHDKIVILTHLDEGAIFADGVTDRFKLIFILILHRLDPVKFFTPALHGQFDEGVTGAGCRWKT